MGKIKNGDFFWAIVDGELTVVMKDKKGIYFMCGNWEGALNETDFKFIEKIIKPKLK
jgi:hypothetical protein